MSVDFIADPAISGVGDGIRRMLLHVPAIQDSLSRGNLVVGEDRQVEEFAVTHTLKRTILNRRTHQGV